MNTETALEKIRGVLPELGRLGAADVRIFGSVVRGEATPESDVDVLIDLHTHDYGTYCRVLEVLESALGSKVDLVLVSALKPERRERVLREALRVA